MENEMFKTSDLALASTLLCLGFKITNINRDFGRAIFCFLKTNKLIESTEDYWADRLTVNPKDFFNCQKEIKTRIYS